LLRDSGTPIDHCSKDIEDESLDHSVLRFPKSDGTHLPPIA